MQTNKWIKWLLIAIVTVMMSACGGGSMEIGATDQDKAIAKIIAYAESNGTTAVPTDDDYSDAGVDLDTTSADDINDYIASLDTTQVDSEEDIQQIADDAGVWLVDTDGDGEKDYADADDDGDGVSDVAEENTGSDPLDANSTAHNGFVYKVVESPYTHRLWLDRNLGALQVCTALDDTECYGDYYQWGRNADGHEKSDSNETDIQADDINNAGVEFITDDGTYNNDWAKMVDANGSLRSANWSKTDGSSICPIGFRVPTSAQLKAELFDRGTARIQGNDDGTKEIVNGSRNAFNSFLKLPSSGRHSMDPAAKDLKGSWGGIWASSAVGFKSVLVNFTSSSADLSRNGDRACGVPVRCLRGNP